MSKISIALLAAAGVLFANGAGAAERFAKDGTAHLGMIQPNLEQVRLVCDEYGRCVRGSRDIVIEPRYRDSYDYAPREPYIEQRDYYEQPRPGVALSAPGVRFGINTNLF